MHYIRMLFFCTAAGMQFRFNVLGDAWRCVMQTGSRGVASEMFRLGKHRTSAVLSFLAIRPFSKAQSASSLAVHYKAVVVIRSWEWWEFWTNRNKLASASRSEENMQWTSLNTRMFQLYVHLTRVEGKLVLRVNIWIMFGVWRFSNSWACNFFYLILNQIYGARQGPWRRKKYRAKEKKETVCTDYHIKHGLLNFEHGLVNREHRLLNAENKLLKHVHGLLHQGPLCSSLEAHIVTKSS